VESTALSGAVSELKIIIVQSVSDPQILKGDAPTSLIANAHYKLLIIIITIIIIIVIIKRNLHSAIMPLGGYRGVGETGR